MVPDERFGQALVLRDTEGVTPGVVTVPAPLIPIVARFTGEHSLSRDRRRSRRRTTGNSGASIIVEKARRRSRRRLVSRGAALPGCPRSGCAPSLPSSRCERLPTPGALTMPTRTSSGPTSRTTASRAAGPRNRTASVRGLVAPHIDPWRGKLGYGHAYSVLRAGLPEEVDTFVLLGTSHAPMSEPFALCRKAFDTPLGAVKADLEAIDRIGARSPFDPFADLLNHKREHSLEFQAVFVRHLVGDREVRIIPILCGIGESQRTGESPEGRRGREKFLGALREIVESAARGPWSSRGPIWRTWGRGSAIQRPYDEAERDAARGNRSGVARYAGRGWRIGSFSLRCRAISIPDGCAGLGPIYSLLRVAPPGAEASSRTTSRRSTPRRGRSSATRRWRFTR